MLLRANVPVGQAVLSNLHLVAPDLLAEAVEFLRVATAFLVSVLVAVLGTVHAFAAHTTVNAAGAIAITITLADSAAVSLRTDNLIEIGRGSLSRGDIGYCGLGVEGGIRDLSGHIGGG